MGKNEVLAIRNGIGLNRQGFRWTAEERAQLMESYYSGIGISDLAVMLQRSEQAIMQQLLLSNAFHRQSKPRNRADALCLCYKCKNAAGCKLAWEQ